ncbi:hypothetical protein [uncultured Nostoc sp.]|uniref:hypothetical protein n=1 Tax=uncultured Nostoc sp. TaxID=340711 RepID=UPI0035CAE65C
MSAKVTGTLRRSHLEQIKSDRLCEIIKQVRYLQRVTPMHWRQLKKRGVSLLPSTDVSILRVEKVRCFIANTPYKVRRSHDRITKFIVCILRSP